jgi:hypothetical protein
MAGSEDLLKLLEITSQRIQNHHSALWEEEKHYSWWIYIIFAGLIYLYLKLYPTSVTFLTPPLKSSIIVAISILGIFISIMGYHVVRKEGEFFYEARQIRARIFTYLNINKSMDAPHCGKYLLPDNETNVEDWDSFRLKANKPFRELFTNAILIPFQVLIKSGAHENKRNLGIRDCFQLTFIITAFLFLAFAIFSAITIIN